MRFPFLTCCVCGKELSRFTGYYQTIRGPEVYFWCTSCEIKVPEEKEGEDAINK